MTTRYIRNDSNLNVENCLLDIRAAVQYLRERGYRRSDRPGRRSGGGTSGALFAGAGRAPVGNRAARRRLDLTAAGLLPADALGVLFMAHPSRARLRHGVAGHPSPTSRALHARRGPRRLQPAERAAVQRRVHRAVPRSPSHGTGGSPPGPSSLLPCSVRRPLAAPGSTISPSWCTARRRTCGSSIPPSTRAAAPPGAPWQVRQRSPITFRPGSAGTRRCVPGSTSGPSTRRSATPCYPAPKVEAPSSSSAARRTAVRRTGQLGQLYATRSK